MRRITYLSIVITSLWGCTQKDLLPAESRERLVRLLDTANVTGLQLHYFDGSNSVDYVYGLKDVRDSSSVSQQTIFQAASLSKQVTALLALRLADAGKLDLQQKISELYQEPRMAQEPRYDQITFEHLLSHSSGLPNWGGDPLLLDFDPGTKWQYSGEGYVLISKTIEASLGTPFNELARQWVFEPLGMTNSSFTWEDRFTGDWALGHNIVQQPGEPYQSNEVNAAASLLTTARDYSLLMKGMTDSDFLSRRSRQLISDEFIDAPTIWGADEANPYIAWSLGAGIQKNESEAALWQWGDNFLFRGMMMYYPESNRGLIYLTNSENGLSIADTLLSFFFEEPTWAVDWMDYEAFDNMERLASTQLERAFVFGDSATAYETYNLVLSRHPDVLTDNLISNTVWSLFGAKRLAPALQLIETHLNNFPNSAETFVRKGEALAFYHDYQGSWQAYQRAMELDGETSRVIMPRFPWYQEAWGALQSNAAAFDASQYVGQYGEISISIGEQGLLYSDSERQQIPLVRLSNELYDLENLETFRLRFDVSGSTITGVTQSHLTGQEVYAEKSGV